MILTPLSQLFTRWLEINEQKFKYKPIKISKHKYIFTNINPEIYLSISDEEKEISIHYIHDEEIYDYHDINYIKQLVYVSNKGFIDKGEIGKSEKRYYTSFKLLVYENLFEDITVFCDKYFVEQNHYFLVNLGTSKLAFIGNENDDSIIKEFRELITDKENSIEIEKYHLFNNKNG